MIPQIDKTMNSIVCFEAPIVDALSEVFFVVGGLVAVYGAYQAVTGKVSKGGTLVASGLIGMLSTSYTKEIAQTSMKSCRV